jgi:poly(3-hydroxybutyrate) depolymerase
MAGPVDCRISPTQVNALATSKPIEWFETRLISTVPLPHRGPGRRVYPGFVQVGAFLQMNLERHLQSFIGLYNSLVEGDDAKAEATKAFYEEYFAELDLTAEFYLETVQQVFRTTFCLAAKCCGGVARCGPQPFAVQRCSPWRVSAMTPAL